MGLEVHTRMCAAEDSSEATKKHHALILDGIIDMYECPMSYRDKWERQLRSIFEYGISWDESSTRLAISIYDEIGLLLGLPTDDMSHMAVWYRIAIDCAVFGKDCIKALQLYCGSLLLVSLRTRVSSRTSIQRPITESLLTSALTSTERHTISTSFTEYATLLRTPSPLLLAPSTCPSYPPSAINSKPIFQH